MPGNPVYRRIGYFVYNDCLAGSDPVSPSAALRLYGGRRHAGGRDRGAEIVFFRLFLYGISVFGAVRLYGVGLFEAGDLLFTAAQGGDCGAFDDASAMAGDGSGRCVLGGACLQLYRRAGVFYNHVHDAVSEAEAQCTLKAYGK